MNTMFIILIVFLILQYVYIIFTIMDDMHSEVSFDKSKIYKNKKDLLFACIPFIWIRHLKVHLYCIRFAKYIYKFVKYIKNL